MAASQGHGFELEKSVRASHCFAGSPEMPHCAEFDVPAGHSDWGALPAQIKCCLATKSTTVMLGDAMRNFDRSRSFELFVACTRQNGDYKDVLHYVRMRFRPADWRSLFGSATRAEIKALDAKVKAIPVGAGKAERKAVHQAKRELQDKRGLTARLQAKMGSDNQRRLQCACPIDDLMRAANKTQGILPGQFAKLGLPTRVFGPPRARAKAHSDV